MSVRGWTSAFLLDFHRSCGATEGDWATLPPRPEPRCHPVLSHAATPSWATLSPVLSHAGSGRVTECDQLGKNSSKYSAIAGNWTRATGRTDSCWVYMWMFVEETLKCWFIDQHPSISPANEIHPSSHWATMTRAMEWTDSEIHSFSHWAIMTRATERTDSEIHSFSHWAIMTRPWRGQTVRYIHSPTEISWPGPRRGQTVRYIHSPTELSFTHY